MNDLELTDEERAQYLAFMVNSVHGTCVACGISLEEFQAALSQQWKQQPDYSVFGGWDENRPNIYPQEPQLPLDFGSARY